MYKMNSEDLFFNVIQLWSYIQEFNNGIEYKNWTNGD